MHDFDDVFREFTYQRIFVDIANTFVSEPIAVQSMYIFKPALIGCEGKTSTHMFCFITTFSKEPPHQDSTYLYTNPPSCLTFWIPMEDATIENGCLYVLPGSHIGKYYDTNSYMNKMYTGTVKTRFRLDRNTNRTYYDPPLGEHGYSNLWSNTKDFVPLECKKGSLVLMDGSLAHMSEKNTLVNSREAYTFRIVDAKCEWYQDNWWVVYRFYVVHKSHDLFTQDTAIWNTHSDHSFLLEWGSIFDIFRFTLMSFQYTQIIQDLFLKIFSVDTERNAGTWHVYKRANNTGYINVCDDE